MIEDTKLLDKASRVRSGDEVEVMVETGRMHSFDPVAGVAIRV